MSWLPAEAACSMLYLWGSLLGALWLLKRLDPGGALERELTGEGPGDGPGDGPGGGPGDGPGGGPGDGPGDGPGNAPSYPGPRALLLCIVMVMDSNIPPTWLNLGGSSSATVFLVLGSV